MDIFQSTIVWIIIAGPILYLLRHRTAGAISRIRLPRPILFLLTGTVFSIIEENINCPGNDCSNPIPFTIPIFVMFLVIHLAIMKMFRIKSFKIGFLTFGLIGWVAEFFLGASVGVLWSSPLIFGLITPWVFLTYGVIVIVPVTILLSEKKPKK